MANETVELYYKGKPINPNRDLPTRTYAEAQAEGLTSSDKLWVRNDGTSTPINAEQIVYDSNNKVSDMFNYSSTEKVCGKWIDGKPLYTKTVDCDTLPNNSMKDVNHSISNISKIVKVEGYAKNSSNTFLPIPFFNSTNTNVRVSAYADTQQIHISTGSVDLSGYTESYVTLYYTKTTD